MLFWHGLLQQKTFRVYIVHCQVNQDLKELKTTTLSKLTKYRNTRKVLLKLRIDLLHHPRELEVGGLIMLGMYILLHHDWLEFLDADEIAVVVGHLKESRIRYVLHREIPRHHPAAQQSIHDLNSGKSNVSRSVC